MLTKIEWLSANGKDDTVWYVNLEKLKWFDVIDTKDSDWIKVYEMYMYLDWYNRAIRMDKLKREALVTKLLEWNK